MRTLVLNAGFEPLAVVSFKRALVLVMNQKATIVSADVEHPVYGSSGSWARPSVILLTRYVRIPNSRLI
ncbi:MAG: HNH endonuclease, partial [Lacisediminihabitans sp.]